MSAKTFTDPLAPVIDKTKHMRALVKSALADYLALLPRTETRQSAIVRGFLRRAVLIERQRPDSTVLGILRMGNGTVMIWCYEAEYAPLGHTPTITLPWSECFRKVCSDRQ